MPAPTDAKRMMSPVDNVCSGNRCLRTRSSKVGMVATELLPSQLILIGVMEGGGLSIPKEDIVSL